jgi:tripartite-type tricarboxylate transporter receptor subunit TctC
VPSACPTCRPSPNRALRIRTPTPLPASIAATVAQPDIKERLTTLGFKAVANTPEQFGARIRLEMDKWGKVVRDAKLRIE